MEFLRHPLYSILAVILLGAVAGALAHATRRTDRSIRGWTSAIFVGIAGAFLGFHFAMLSNLATGVILMPFAVALVISLLASFALRGPAR